MNDDIRLQELFDDFRPTLTDSEQFSSQLERRLAMIDEIRETQAAEIRRYRMAVVAAFVAGIVFGSVLLAVILATPSETPLFSFGINAYPLLFIEQNSRLISALLPYRNSSPSSKKTNTSTERSIRREYSWISSMKAMLLL